jgi:L-iditol 2-dehydrogenase
MKVLRLHGKRDLLLHEEPVPVSGLDTHLLRVAAVGICGSDLQWLDKEGIGDARVESPLVLGHEFAAVIDDGPHRGRRVAVDPAIVCHRCRYCEEGTPNFCENMRFAGHGKEDGALREKLVWPRSNVYVLPEEMTAIEGAMLEPLGVAIHALDLGHVKPGMTVGVFGCGPVGLLLIQLIKAAGATRIVATDRLPHRLEAARNYGASTIVTAAGERGNAELRKIAGGEGLDIAFEAANHNDALAAAIDAVRPGRQVVAIGIPEDDRTTYTASIARRKGLTIKHQRRMTHTYPRAIHLVRRGCVDVGSLVTHRFPLSDFASAFEVAQKREGIKVVIEP